MTSIIPPGLPKLHVEAISQGGSDSWLSYEGEILLENVMVVDEDRNKVRSSRVGRFM
jgi:hypothetical protein